MVESAVPNLKTLWEVLQCLVKPTSNGVGEIKNLHEALSVNLRKARSVLGVEDFRRIPNFGNTVNCGSDLVWDFVELTLLVLLCLKERLRDDELSVSQQKDIRSSLQFIVSLGIYPNLMPKLRVGLSVNDGVVELLKEGTVTDIQKYERLCVVVQYLLNCCDTINFRSLIVSNIICQLLMALFQLSFAPIKKPALDVCPSSSSEESFTMTEDLWKKLQEDQKKFRTLLKIFVNETFQPKIMTELMLLQGNEKGSSPPLWLRKASSHLLTSCLIRPGGVAALIHATFDAAPDIGSDWKKIETVSRIVTSPDIHLCNICEQLLNLVEISYNDPHGMQLVVVACIKQLFEKDELMCQKSIIKPILQPLTEVLSKTDKSFKEDDILLSEEKLSSVVKKIHMCFTSHNCEVSCINLPGKILIPFSSFFFHLLCKVNGSVSILWKCCEDVLYQILCDSDQEALLRILKSILLSSDKEEIYPFRRNFSFTFASNGGVSLTVSQENTKRDIFSSSVEEAGNRLIEFLEKRRNSQLNFCVFEILLKILIDIGVKPNTNDCVDATLGTWEDTLSSLMLSSEKHLGIVRLLAALVENDDIKKSLSENPGAILKFIFSILNGMVQVDPLKDSEEDEDLECVFVAFMILNVMLDDCGKHTEWSLFENLLQPVSIICNKSKNEELKRLASRAYNIISTCGAVQDATPSMSKECIRTKCEEALHDACDPLLPVRGHALVQLSKLLRQHDKETLAKKEAVLCLFKENLSNSDSYIYLAAINGMVSFAGIQPDEAVKSLTQEYVAISSANSDVDRNPELRMKVGEILVKLVRELGVGAQQHKNELLNAFLVGSKDVDHLMRASSLSNLGEVCQILGFRVGPILGELLLCVKNTLKFDKAIEPRRASVMVVTQLLRGLEADTLTTLEDSVLELYRTLKDIYLNDRDDVVRLHAQLALEELGRLARDILFPKLPLSKKIQVLPAS